MCKWTWTIPAPFCFAVRRFWLVVVAGGLEQAVTSPPAPLHFACLVPSPPHPCTFLPLGYCPLFLPTTPTLACPSAQRLYPLPLDFPAFLIPLPLPLP